MGRTTDHCQVGFKNIQLAAVVACPTDPYRSEELAEVEVMNQDIGDPSPLSVCYHPARPVVEQSSDVLDKGEGDGLPRKLARARRMRKTTSASESSQ